MRVLWYTVYFSLAYMLIGLDFADRFAPCEQPLFGSWLLKIPFEQQDVWQSPTRRLRSSYLFC